jgi:hypothetical protein
MGIWFPAGVRGFYLLHSAQDDIGDQKFCLIFIDARGLFTRDDSASSSGQVKIAWSYTFIPTYIVAAGRLIKRRDKFTYFYFISNHETWKYILNIVFVSNISNCWLASHSVSVLFIVFSPNKLI